MISDCVTIYVFQIQSEKVCSSEKTVQNTCKKEPHRKQYLELRKKFGLSKEERVYLKRIPFGISPTGSKASVSSINLKNNDSCSASPLEMEVTTRKQENAEEKKVSQKFNVCPTIGFIYIFQNKNSTGD